MAHECEMPFVQVYFDKIFNRLLVSKSETDSSDKLEE